MIFSATLIACSVSLARLALADPFPLEPSADSVYDEGSTCSVGWMVDPTGLWTTMNIELMSGSNEDMIHLKTVGTVDGTIATLPNETFAEFDYPCLDVTPNSAIYFYQFSSPLFADLLWTTRFTIAGPQGQTTPPPNQTQPDGEAIPWGDGALVDPSQGDAPPPRGTAIGSGAFGPSTSVPISTPLSLSVSATTTTGGTTPVQSSPTTTTGAGIEPTLTTSLTQSSLAPSATNGVSPITMPNMHFVGACSAVLLGLAALL